MITKPFEEWTWDELLQWNQAKLILSIPTGKFNETVFSVMDLTLRWKAAADAKKGIKP